jgi:hypothetical protein
MRVKLDQTGLDRFLVQCANSRLTIEVRQLRINPTDDRSMAFGEMPAFGGGDFRGGGGDFRGGGGDFRGGGDRPMFTMQQQFVTTRPTSNLTGAAAVDAQSTTDIIVEIYGIVFIYNPVDPKVLGGMEAEGAEVPLAAASAL